MRRAHGEGATPADAPSDAELASAPLGAPDSERVAASTPAPAPSSEAKPERPAPLPVPGAIRARVRDKDDLPVGALVALFRERERVAANATDDEGRTRFDSLAPGDYRLEVDPASLPPGYIPPFEQESIVHYQEHVPAGYFGRAVKIEGTGDEHSVDLRVFQPASVDGYLLGPEGEPVADAHVRLQSNGRGLERLVGDAMTDSSGFFSIPAMHPGRYVTELHFDRRHPYLQVTRPEPVSVALDDGEHRTLALRMATGDWSLAGRVVDDEGEPFARIDVRCSYWPDPESLEPDERIAGGEAAVAFTDQRGRYEFIGLPDRRLRIIVGIDEHTASRVPGERSIVGTQSSASYDGARISGRVEVPDIVVRRSRPFVVSGRVEVDDAWRERKELRQRDFELRARTADGKEQRVELARDWRFQWWCETPCEPVELVVEASRRAATYGIARTRVVPEPNGRVSIVLRIP
jgi:protocatechuate 3,4-dioxygenase beta subunit